MRILRRFIDWLSAPGECWHNDALETARPFHYECQRCGVTFIDHGYGEERR